jgi:hypothetical protein
MAADTSDDAGVPTRVYRTVSPPYRDRPNPGMQLIGILIFAGLLVVLFPLGVFVILFWLVSRLVR